MVVGIFVDDVSAQVDALHKKAREARETGDMEGFFRYSHEVLNLVNGWIDRKKVRKTEFQKSFEGSIKDIKTDIDLQIAFNYLDLAIKKVQLGLSERKFDLMELNKHLIVKTV